MSGLNNGHIHEFPYIRVDSFSQSQTLGFPAAQLYLLTHAHTDHLTGLDNASTNIVIICSEVTKRLVLNYEREKDRIAFDRKVIERRKKAYQGFAAASEAALAGTTTSGHKRKRLERTVVRDPFRVIPFDVPHPYELGYDPATGRTRWVVITMLDANHCPGSAMFLLTDPTSGVTVLHTGDVRPDRPFLDRLERHPAVMPYLGKIMGMEIAQQDSSHAMDKSEIIIQGAYRNKRLERIYLDTSAVIGTCDMPSKEEAVRGLIQTLQLYPPDTIFYLYTWTTGQVPSTILIILADHTSPYSYEDALKAIAMVFGTKIHVDRWRYLNYQNVVDDPVLQMLCTTDANVTRFHTCERHNQCAAVQAAFEPGSGKRVVTVEFIEEKAVEHAVKMKEVQKECLLAMQDQGRWPMKLYCPLARHATLPELQALLDLFKPKALSPNTLVPFLKGADYYAMIAAFGDCLAPGGKEELRQDCLQWFKREKGLRTEEKVCAFARRTLLFGGNVASVPAADNELDLRPGRSANRQRQSDAFLPSLPVATKSTLNSPRAHSIPAEPPILVSPSAVMRKDDQVPVFGKTDPNAYVKDYLADLAELMDEDDQDTQVQKARESRNHRSARKVPSIVPPVVALRERPDVGMNVQQQGSERPKFIFYPASPRSERILKRTATYREPHSSMGLPPSGVERELSTLTSPTVEDSIGDPPTATAGRNGKLPASPELRKALPPAPKEPRSAKKSGNIRLSLQKSFDI